MRESYSVDAKLQSNNSLFGFAVHSCKKQLILPLQEMIRTEKFWEDEFDAPLLERNLKFVNRGNQDNMSQRVGGWMDLLDIPGDISIDKLTDVVVSEENLRIFRRDAERTYVPKDEADMEKRTKARQDIHVETLKLIVAEVQDYHQGLGYIVAFLNLFLDTPDVVRVALTLHRDPKYSAGYFVGAPQRFVADGRVFYQILEKSNPDLHRHLTSKGVLPEMFASKWFIGLCLHVLPYEALFAFYENFLTQGVEYIFRFSLKYLQTLESELMEAKDTHHIMTLLRAEDPRADWKLPPHLMERHLSEDIFIKIVTEASSVDLGVDLDSLRHAEGRKVAEAVEAARKRDQELKELYSDDEIVFSDEE